MTPVKFTKTGESSELVFTPPKGFDFLTQTYLSIETPNVEVIPEEVGSYQIRWCDDMCFHIVTNAKLNIGGMKNCSMDNYWMAFFPHFFGDANHEYSMNRDCGNFKEFTKWSEHLPIRKLKPPQPWYYSRNYNWAFPVFRLYSQNSLSHIYTVDRRVRSFLRMRKKVNGKWVNIPPDFSVLRVTDSEEQVVSSIQNIHMFGEMAQITDAEKQKVHLDGDIFIFEDIVANDLTSASCEQTIEINSASCSGVIKAQYWAAQNLVAAKNNDYSNFTSCASDRDKGRNPILEVSMAVNGKEKFESFDADDFSGVLARPHFKSTPKIVGLHAKSHCSKMRAQHDTGIISPGANTSFKFTMAPAEKNGGSTDYKIIFRSQINKYMRFVNGKVEHVV
jgi:hypothetical protein